MRIGLITDTHLPALIHSLDDLGPEAGAFFRTVDLILHGGDVTAPSVLDWLEQFAPVLVSKGNNDAFHDPRVQQVLARYGREPAYHLPASPRRISTHSCVSTPVMTWMLSPRLASSMRRSTVYSPQRRSAAPERPPITRVLMPLARIAPQHIGQGSNVVYSVEPGNSTRFSARPATLDVIRSLPRK